MRKKDLYIDTGISKLYLALVNNRIVSSKEVASYLSPLINEKGTEKNILNSAYSMIQLEDSELWKNATPVLKTFKNFILGKAYLLSTNLNVL